MPYVRELLDQFRNTIILHWHVQNRVNSICVCIFSVLSPADSVNNDTMRGKLNTSAVYFFLHQIYTAVHVPYWFVCDNK